MLGTQWGDEGKGKLVDILAQQYDVIARAQVSKGAVSNPLRGLCCWGFPCLLAAGGSFSWSMRVHSYAVCIG